MQPNQTDSKTVQQTEGGGTVASSDLLASKRCGKCVHIVNIPGNCHIGCDNSNAHPKRMKWPGCGMWPWCFDALIVESCDGYSEDPKDKIVRKENPLLELARLFAG